MTPRMSSDIRAGSDREQRGSDWKVADVSSARLSNPSKDSHAPPKRALHVVPSLQPGSRCSCGVAADDDA